MIRRESRVRFTNGNGSSSHLHQKQFFHIMLCTLLKLGSAGFLPVIMAILGISTIYSSTALAAKSDDKTQLSIGSRLKASVLERKTESLLDSGLKANSSDEKAQLPVGYRLKKALSTLKEVKGQDSRDSSILESSDISPPLEQIVQLAEAGDTPVSPMSPGGSQSDSLFEGQGESLFEQQPSVPQEQQTQLEPVNPIQENSTPTTRQRSRAEVQLDISPVGDPVVQADGRSTIQIRGEIINQEGEVIPRDVLVTLTSSAGKFIGSDQDKDAPGFQARAINGEFIATLQSGIKPQSVRIRAAIHKIKKPASTLRQRERSIDGEILLESGRDTRLFNNELVSQAIEAYTQVEFTTYLRPSLVTGIINLRIGARGTNFWGSRREFLDPYAVRVTVVDLVSLLFATG